MSLSTKYQVDPKIPSVLPFEKMYSIQIGDRLFRLSGASISFDSPSYFTSFFGRKENESKVLTVDRSSAVFDKICSHLQGYCIRADNEYELMHFVPDHVPEPVFPRRAKGRDPPPSTEPDRGQAQRQAVHRSAQCAVDGPHLRRQRTPPPPAAGGVPLLPVSCSGAETDSAQDPDKPVHSLRGDCRCASRRQEGPSLDHVRGPSRVQTALCRHQGARAGAPDRFRGGQSTDPHRALVCQSIIYRRHRAPSVHTAEPTGRRPVRIDGARGRQCPGEAANVRFSG
ncbi:hypothetical protein KL905_001584 [Ogataea polymorpha]|nr:hypothetical protein KL937_000055 [Ogataea polymorpha]KAG7889684.1 hypothetical protein KL908_004797 [Ogataea polymorpha]KAG7895567.1 hypothetical protein KL936_000275 [Ogataea polymorpha]KAG7905966.1 hypothetical protein KL906_005036 [Ogataea polymorpha]KAG7908142.1 hypothetical protein KL907_001632 [Ogataea polymorpha]